VKAGWIPFENFLVRFKHAVDLESPV
jgi:hypothetical protein